VARVLAFERGLDLGKDAAEAAVQVGEACVILLEGLPVGIAQLVLEGDYGPGVNSHGGR
jgi:hypothetical protein